MLLQEVGILSMFGVTDPHSGEPLKRLVSIEERWSELCSTLEFCFAAHLLGAIGDSRHRKHCYAKPDTFPAEHVSMDESSLAGPGDPLDVPDDEFDVWWVSMEARLLT